MREIKNNWENVWKRDGFVFIFSDTWTNDQDKLDRYGDIVKGSFAFQFDTDFGVSIDKSLRPGQKFNHIILFNSIYRTP